MHICDKTRAHGELSFRARRPFRLLGHRLQPPASVGSSQSDASSPSSVVVISATPFVAKALSERAHIKYRQTSIIT